MKKLFLISFTIAGISIIGYAQNQSYYNYNQNLQSATTTCNTNNAHFGEGCLKGKKLNSNRQPVENNPPCGCSAHANYIQETDRAYSDVVKCNQNNPHFGDNCLIGKNGDSKFSQYNIDYYQQSSNNQQQYAQQSSIQYRDTEWKNQISVKNQFGSKAIDQPSATTNQPYRQQNIVNQTQYRSVGVVAGIPGSSSQKTYYANEAKSVYNQPTQQRYNQPEYREVNVEASGQRVSNNALYTHNNTIDGFWGVKFGMDQNKVLSSLFNSSILERNNLISTTENSVLLQNVNFANIRYDNATLMFKDNVLSSGLFLKTYPYKNEADADIQSIIHGLTSKYGKPNEKQDIASTRYYWHDNNNQRTIMVELKPIGENSFYALDLFYVDRVLSRVNNENVVEASSNARSNDY